MPGEKADSVAEIPAGGGLALSITTALLSLLLMGALAAVFIAYQSQLAFAQAADSLSDVFTAGVLAWSVAIGRKPRDANHHFGHGRAEPIGALVAAVMAGVLAFAVIRSAIDSLVRGDVAHLDWPAGVVFGSKTLIKAAVAIFAWRMLKRRFSPAVSALMVDARNDALVNCVAIVGGAAAFYGWAALDAWLALPTGLWIGFAGFKLARDNIRLLMGEAPSAVRQLELLRLAREVPGVLQADDLRAHYIGTSMQVSLRVVVRKDLSAEQAHDIAAAVRKRLDDEADVADVFVHIDLPA